MCLEIRKMKNKENIMIKIIHTADLHIGASFNSFENKLDLQKYHTLAVIEMVKFANLREVDIMIIAGDLFDGHAVDGIIRHETMMILGNFRGKIYISTGNHDYYFKGSFWDKMDLPSNVHLFRENKLCEISLGDVSVYGASFTNIYEKIDIKNADLDENKINIAVLHSDILTKSEYNPLSKEDFSKSKFDYVATGHNHSFSEILKASNTKYACSGSISATGFDEIGEKGFIYGEISKENSIFSFITSKGAMILKEKMDISNISNISELISKISLIAKENIYLDLTLEGIKTFDFDINSLKNEINALYIEIFDMTKTEEDLWGYLGEENLLGEFSRIMYEKYRNQPSLEVLDALRIGLDALKN